jgi:hypothetical protein
LLKLHKGVTTMKGIRAFLPISLAGFLLAFASFSLGTAKADVNLVQNPLFSIQPSGGLPYSCGATCSYDLGGNDVGNCCVNDSTTIPDWSISAFTQGAGEEIPGSVAPAPLPGGVTTDAFTSGGSISQSLGTTVIGTTYNFSAWVTDTGFNGESTSLYVGNGGFPSSQYYAKATAMTTANGWTLLSGTYTATTTQPLTVILFNQGGDGQQYFADVCVTTGANCTSSSSSSAAPEPGYYAVVFGLGFLMVAVRVRRAKQSA